MAKATVKEDTKYEAMTDVHRPGTKLFALATLLGDKRRKNGVPRSEIVEKLGFDPAPYITMYDCFERVGRGVYTYVGEALPEVKAAAKELANAS